MELKTYQLRIPSDLYYNQNISGLDIVVYSYMQAMSFGYLFEKYCFHTNDVAYQIYKTNNIQRENIVKITESIERILEFDFIHGEKIFRNTYIVDPSSMLVIPHYYTIVDFCTIENILSSQYSYKFNLVKMYLLVLGGRHYGKYINFMAVTWYANNLCCSESTVLRYTTALENMNLIYVFRNDFQNSTNLYGDIKDKDKILEYANKKNRSEVKQNANKKRSLIMKYNYIVKSGECHYSQDELREIRKAILQHNTDVQSYKERFPEADVKIYDPKVLDKYLT